MKSVAKLVLIDDQNKYLLLYRDNHPTFGNDPDLPGGTAEGDESMTTVVLREVMEETGVKLQADQVQEIFASDTYSEHGTLYTLFVARLSLRPEVLLSWEHATYEWVSKETFLATAKSANDTYMHMVYDALVAEANVKLFSE